MNEKQVQYYDGSVQNLTANTEANENEPFKLTDEMRLNVSGNPYQIENTK